MLQMLDAHYIAGILDGEGYLGLIWKSSGKGRPHAYLGPVIRVSNTNEQLITLLATQLGGQVASHTHLLKNPRWKMAWYWNVSSWSSVRAVLDVVQPYLIVKQPQAVVMRQFLDTMQRQQHQWGMHKLPQGVVEERQRLFDLMRVLNHRGRIVVAAQTERACPSQEGEATVGTPWQHGEAGRNVLPRFDVKLS